MQYDIHRTPVCLFMDERHSSNCVQNLCHKRHCGCEIAVGHPTWRGKLADTPWTDLKYVGVGRGGIAWNDDDFPSPPGTTTNSTIKCKMPELGNLEHHVITSVVHPPLDVRWHPRSRHPTYEESPVYLEQDRRIRCEGFERRNTGLGPWCRKPSHRAGLRWAWRASKS
eukprot:GEMP01075893.1.p1 GENE.GEMP01075893.1~~GEMP01075893.1.p1  ORF type:complete len:168 (+),score=23.02 GEMP01075893.1:262-765(+)